MKIVYTLLVSLFLGSTSLISQNTCESPENTVDELNSIKKCLVEKKEKPTRKALTTNYTPKKRFLTVRKKTVSSVVNSINSKGIATNKTNTIQSESLIALRKEYSFTIFDFNSVDKVPVFKNCENINSDQEQRICFNKKMMLFINENMEYSEEALDEDVSGVISVKFVIDTNGEVNNILVSGAKQARALKESIIDLISQLPTLTPAEKNNQLVPMKYEFLLNFSM